MISTFRNTRSLGVFAFVLLLLGLAGCRKAEFDSVPQYQFVTSATPVPADIKICGGYTIKSNQADIDWGDGHEYGTLGSPAGEPPYLNYLVGQHKFTKSGVFTVAFTLTVTCANNNYPDWGDSVKGTSTAYVFDQPVGVASIAVALPAINVNQNAACKVTLSAQAPKQGTQVLLTFASSNSGSIQIPKTVDVKSGQTIGNFPNCVMGVASGTVQIFATSGEGNPVASAILKVN